MCGYLITRCSCYNQDVQKEKSEIIQTVKKVMPAVISIVVSKKLEAVERELKNSYPTPFQDTPMNIPPDKIDAHGMVQVGGGSGFIVNSKGIILTNKHVISEPMAEYTVITNDGKKFPAEILARDPIDDIAILKIHDYEKLPSVVLGNSNEIELGETVLAFGNALGIFKSTVSMGIVSGLSRTIEAKPDPEAPAQEMRGLIQTDAAINPGNSGGPLTDIFGQVIGINAAVIAGAQNIGFAIPIKNAERDLKDLEKYGKIKRPLLGIRYLTLSPEIKEKIKTPSEYGALVTKNNPLELAVTPMSPADKAGIQEQDIILEWNGEKITPEKNIQDFLENCAVDQKIILTVLRKGRTLKKQVLLTERR